MDDLSFVSQYADGLELAFEVVAKAEVYDPTILRQVAAATDRIATRDLERGVAAGLRLIAADFEDAAT